MTARRMRLHIVSTTFRTDGGHGWTWLRGARQVDVVLAGLTRIRAHRSIGGPRSVCGERQQHHQGSPTVAPSRIRHLGRSAIIVISVSQPRRFRAQDPVSARRRASPVWPDGMPRL